MNTVRFEIRVDDAERAKMLARTLRELDGCCAPDSWSQFARVENALEKQKALNKLTEQNNKELADAFKELRAEINRHWKGAEITPNVRAALDVFCVF